MKLADWLEWRQEKKQDFAKKLGIHPSYISHIIKKKGGRRCPVDMAEKIEQLTDGQVTRLELVWPDNQS